MVTLLQVLCCFAGIHLTMLLLAAGYRFVDLWYCIGTAWPMASVRLFILLAINAAALELLGEPFARAFVMGQIGYVLYHIGIYWLIRLGLEAIMARRDRR